MEEGKCVNGIYVGTIYLHKLKVKIPYVYRGKAKGFTVARLDLITKTPRNDLERYDKDKIKAKLGLKEEHKFEIISCETIETNTSYKEHSNIKREN